MASGHGHVYPAGDPPGSLRARCGGPTLCRVCFGDLSRSLAANDGYARRWLDQFEGSSKPDLLAKLAEDDRALVRLPELTVEEARVLGDVLRVALEGIDGLGGEAEVDLGPDAAAIARSLRTAVAEAVAAAERTAVPT